MSRWDWDVAPLVECWPPICEALGSISSVA